MWGGAQNVAGLFLDSSGDSGFTFGEAVSTVRTVQTSAAAVDCENNWDSWGTAANEALAAAEPSINPDSYDYRVYYIPNINCGFGGVAYMACSEPRYCRAYTAVPSATVVAHELGHSAGVRARVCACVRACVRVCVCVCCAVLCPAAFSWLQCAPGVPGVAYVALGPAYPRAFVPFQTASKRAAAVVVSVMCCLCCLWPQV
jgi:hypothetical protein